MSVNYNSHITQMFFQWRENQYCFRKGFRYIAKLKSSRWECFGESIFEGNWISWWNNRKTQKVEYFTGQYLGSWKSWCDKNKNQNCSRLQETKQTQLNAMCRFRLYPSQNTTGIKDNLGRTEDNWI